MLAALILMWFCGSVRGQAADPEKRYRVVNGILTEIKGPALRTPNTDGRTGIPDSLRERFLEMGSLPDSLLQIMQPDNISFLFGAAADGAEETLSTRETEPQLAAETVAERDTLYDGLGRRHIKRLARAERRADITLDHHWLFDSIPLSRMTAVSIPVPGFSQFYNKQYWKIPVLYGTVGAATYFAVQENKKYQKWKAFSDFELANDPNVGRDILDPIQTKMIRHNTRRQLLFAGAIASYIYFLGDGAVNYPGSLTRIKKATTLSTICPGAGQIYNGSYWKVPIVMGGFATFAYMVDWNNRGYQRFKTAYDLRTDGNEKTKDEFDSYPNITETTLKNLKNSYRRNRDLCIIIMAAWYLLNIVDAHVDAHLKDYDVSDDLGVDLQPVLINIGASGSQGRSAIGLSLSYSF